MRVRHKRKTRKLQAQINIVPYVDVFIVLLVIFMITTPIISQSIKVKLPEAEKSSSIVKGSNKPLVITIDKNGQYFINLYSPSNKSLTKNEILSFIKTNLILYRNNTTYIRGDIDVNYGEVINLMSILQNAGITKIGLVTEKEKNK